ncbi:MAG: hypothetical protein ACLFST_09915 [Spirochaetia bacterium]
MGEYLDQIPEGVKEHLVRLVKTAGLEDNEESVEMISQAWLEKKETFERRIEQFNMEETDNFEKDDENAALMITYSGSILSIGPVVDGVRKVEYSSIGMRKDVPESASDESSTLSRDIELDDEVVFDKGPIRKSSPIFKIALFTEEMDSEEQEEKLSDATQMLTEDFVQVNKTVIIE